MADAFEAERADAVPIDVETGRRLPLHAFALLDTGDAFDVINGAPPKDGKAKATAYIAAKVSVSANGASAQQVEAVKAEIVQLLLGNLQLINRLSAGRPIAVELIPSNRSMASFGYPQGASARAAGLFWDHPSWPSARIALLQTALASERALVTHEMAHAVQRLAFTQAEQDSIYRLMLPVYRYRSWVDEVFAIYSEREFLPFFTEREGHAPGVYGMARQRWDERHVFTRFVRNLYHPHKPLAANR